MAVLTRRELVQARAHLVREPRDYWLRVYRHAMACRFEITLAGEDAQDVAAARRALDRIDDIEARLTVFRDTSMVSRLNRTAAAGPVAVDDDLVELLILCQTLYEKTAGAFDVTSMPLSRCWGFMRREGRLPSREELEAARARVGMSHVFLNRAHCTMHDRAHCTVHFDREGLELNFGAIGKGWALDRIAHTLGGDGVRRALLSAGRSSVRAIEGLPRRSSEGMHRAKAGWCINVASPRVDRPLARVRLREGAMGTSGAGEQFFEVEGKRYGHVIDPRTGWPAEGALSVSVITSQAAVADALSTAFFVGGADLARAYCDRHADVLVLFTPDDASRRTTVMGHFSGADVELE